MYPTFDSGGHFGKDALLTSEMDRDGLRVGQPRLWGWAAILSSCYEYAYP